MYKLLISIFTLLFLGSCDVSNKVGKDGYTFGTPTYEKKVVEITLVTYDSRQDLLREARRYKQNNPNIQAFAVLRKPFDKCEVHIMSPKTHYQPEFYGHELTHCFYGQWHTNNQSTN